MIMVVTTRKINSLIESSNLFRDEVYGCLDRFHRHDWGTVCKEDWDANDRDIETGGGALGVYETSQGEIWINDDTQCVCVMFPDEY